MRSDDFKRLHRALIRKGDDDPEIVERMNQMSDYQIDVFCAYAFGRYPPSADLSCDLSAIQSDGLSVSSDLSCDLSSGLSVSSDLSSGLSAVDRRRIVDFSCDWWERQHGDGYYPFVLCAYTNSTNPNNANTANPNTADSDTADSDESIQTHVFELIDQDWVQICGDCILGLDGDSGPLLLELLNDPTDVQQMTKLCFNRMMLVRKSNESPPNELPKLEFAYKVVDMMINCGWKSQADEIISYIGGLSGKRIRNRAGKVLFDARI